jgi:hypothetical protein
MDERNLADVLIMLDTLWKTVDRRIWTKLSDAMYIRVTYHTRLAYCEKEIETRTRMGILASPIQAFMDILRDSVHRDTTFDVMNMPKKEFVSLLRQYESSLMACYKSSMISKIAFRMESTSNLNLHTMMYEDIFEVENMRQPDLARVYELFDAYPKGVMSMRVCFAPAYDGRAYASS